MFTSPAARPLRIAIDMTLPDRTRTGSWVYATELLARLQHMPEYSVTVVNHPKRWRGATWGGRFLNAADLTLWMQVSFPRRMAREQPDILHAPAFIMPVLSPCPVVLNIHDTTYLTLATDTLWGLYARVFTALAVHRAAAILTLSESSRRDIVRYYGISSQRVVVAPLGVDSRFHPMDRAEARGILANKYGLSDPFILFVGALEKRKNLPTLLQAFAELKRTGAGEALRLVIVGRRGGAWPEIERLVENLGLTSEVIFVGHVPADDLPLFYNGAQAFVFPSLYEGFGIPVLEAMACGSPVITSNVSSLPEVGGDAVLYVAPDDVQGLMQTMARVLSDRDLSRSLSEQGKKRAAMFSWEHSVRLTAALYEDVYQRRAHAAISR